MAEPEKQPERTYEVTDGPRGEPVIMEVHGENKVYYTPRTWDDEEE